jgi:hypothetical protein
MPPEISLSWPDLLGNLLALFALALLGVVVAAHMLLTLNFLPAGSPACIVLPPVVAVAASVYTVHGAFVGAMLQALWGAAATCAALICFQIVLWLKGMTVCDHVRQWLKQ